MQWTGANGRNGVRPKQIFQWASHKSWAEGNDTYLFDDDSKVVYLLSWEKVHRRLKRNEIWVFFSAFTTSVFRNIWYLVLVLFREDRGTQLLGKFQERKQKRLQARTRRRMTVSYHGSVSI